MPYGLKDIELQKLCKVFESNERIERVVLYGSRAKGNYKPFSDVDITLIGEELTHTDLNRISLAIDDLLLPYQFDISVFHTLKNEALIDHIHRVGITIYERESEWKEYKLGELIQSISETYKFKPREKVVFLNTSDILDGKFLTDNLSEASTLPGQAKKKIQKGDILYSEIRPANKRFALVDFDCDNYVVSTKLMVLRCNDNVDNRFIYNYLTSKEVLEYLQMVAEDRSGTFPQITFDIIANMDIELPTIEEQRRIASILTSLDDKIDLLRRENATLEAMAETLFRQWFVVEAKEEWEEGKLGDLIDVKYGKDHKKLSEGTIPVIGSGGVMRYADKYLYDKESVLIPRKGSLNNVMYINEPFWTVDTMFYTEMSRSNIAKYVYHFMKGQDLANMNVGSAVPSMTTEVLNNIPVDIPPQGVFDRFENAVAPLYNKKEQNNKQIQTLIQTRDGLLPRLMGGEITL